MAKRKKAASCEDEPMEDQLESGELPAGSDGEKPVGYKNPPLKSRWKKGGPSPNPRGRPKGSESLTTILKRELGRRYSITEGGRRKKIKALDIIITQAVTDTMKGKVKAFDRLITLTRLAGMFDEEPQTITEQSLTPEERHMIDALFAKKKKPE